MEFSRNVYKRRIETTIRKTSVLELFTGPGEAKASRRLPMGTFWISRFILQLQKVEVVLCFDL
jgi:hypothetical protein